MATIFPDLLRRPIARALVMLALAAGLASGQAPAPQPAPAPPPVPKAVASVKGAYPSGSLVFVDASGSVSARRLQVKVIDRPTEFRISADPDSTPEADRRGVYSIFPVLPDGHYFVSVTAVVAPDLDHILTDTTVVEFTVGVAPTPPRPDVPVAPAFVPANPVQGFGVAYASADVRAMADTWDESAVMLAAGTPIADISKSFGQRWQARRTPAFKAAGDAFAAISPAGSDPATPTARAALAAAWRDFAAGLRGGLTK